MTEREIVLLVIKHVLQPPALGKVFLIQKLLHCIIMIDTGSSKTAITLPRVLEILQVHASHFHCLVYTPLLAS
jgi:hypothetical protein